MSTWVAGHLFGSVKLRDEGVDNNCICRGKERRRGRRGKEDGKGRIGKGRIGKGRDGEGRDGKGREGG